MSPLCLGTRTEFEIRVVYSSTLCHQKKLNLFNFQFCAFRERYSQIQVTVCVFLQYIWKYRSVYVRYIYVSKSIYLYISFYQERCIHKNTQTCTHTYLLFQFFFSGETCIEVVLIIFWISAYLIHIKTLKCYNTLENTLDQ